MAAYPTTPPSVPIPIPDITPVNSLPSPINLVAVMIPALGLSIVIFPSEQIVAAVPTLTPPVAVVTPEILTSSKLVIPSTSKSALTSTLPANVRINGGSDVLGAGYFEKKHGPLPLGNPNAGIQNVTKASYIKDDMYNKRLSIASKFNKTGN